MVFWEAVARLWARLLGLLREKDRYGVSLLVVQRLVPRWAAAQTWGRVILVVSGYEDSPVIAHELIHVTQWQRYGFWFPLAYLWGSFVAWVLGGQPYRDNPFEIEARVKSGY